MALGTLVDYSEHDVVPFYAFTGASAQRGQLVSLSTGQAYAPFSYPTTLAQNYGSSIPAAPAAGNNTVYSARNSNVARVKSATSGEKPFGVLLFNVAETDQYGQPLIFNQQRKEQLLCVCSGEANPILRKGMVHSMLFDAQLAGTEVGSGVRVSTTSAGKWQVCAPGATNSFGIIIAPLVTGSSNISNSGAVCLINCW